MRKKVLGEAHPSVATTIALMGLVLRDQGDYAGALSYYEECLEIQKKSLGEAHPQNWNIENHIFFATALWQPTSLNMKMFAKHKKRVTEMSWSGAEGMRWRLRLIDVLLTGSSVGLHQAGQELSLLKEEAIKKGYEKSKIIELKAVEEFLLKLN